MKELKELREWLNNHPGSLMKIARAAGISKPTIYKVKNMEEPNVSITTVRKLMKVKKEGKWR